MKLFRQMVKTLGIIIVAGLIGILLLVLVNLLPSGRIRNYVAESLQTFEDEGNYPYYGPKRTGFAGDNWTEAVLYNFMYTADNSKPLYSALVMREYRQSDDVGGVERLAGLLADEKWESSGFLLERSSYWLGYTIILRPLLLFLDYSSIKCLSLFVASAMALFLILYLSKKANAYIAMVSGLILVCFNYFVVAYHIPLGFFCMFISFAIVMYMFQTKEIDVYMLFLFSGILTAYFEWFSIPFITWGIPFSFYLYVNRSIELKGKMRGFAKSAIGWCVGYASMIVLKSVVAMAVIGEKGWTYFIDRFKADGIGESRTIIGLAKGIRRLILEIFPFNVLVGNGANKFLYIVLGLLVIAIVICFFVSSDKIQLVLYLIVGISPLAWYIVFWGHIGHVGIDYRTLMISAFSIAFIFEEPISKLMIRNE